MIWQFEDTQIIETKGSIGYLYTHDHLNIIPNRQKVEATHMNG